MNELLGKSHILSCIRTVELTLKIKAEFIVTPSFRLTMIIVTFDKLTIEFHIVCEETNAFVS